MRGPTYVLERVDALGGLLNLTSDNLRDKLVGQGLESTAAGLTGDDLSHLLADGTDLGRGSVGGLLDLVGSALGEGNDKEAEEIVVGGLDSDVALDQGLPLADKRPQLVGGEVEAVEVGQAVLALDLVNSELDLAERVVLILLQVGQGNLHDTALQRVVGVLETGGPVDQSLTDTKNRGTFVRLQFSLFFYGHRRCGLSRYFLLSDLERSRSLFARGSVWAGLDCICVFGVIDIGTFRTLMAYQSLREKGSTVFFLRPFLPLDNLLFLL